MRERDLRNKIVFDAHGLRLGCIQSVRLREGSLEEVESATLKLDRWFVGQWPELATDLVGLDPSAVASIGSTTLRLSLTYAELRERLRTLLRGASRSG